MVKNILRSENSPQLMRGSFMNPICSILFLIWGGVSEGGFTSKNYYIQTKQYMTICMYIQSLTTRISKLDCNFFTHFYKIGKVS
jgi:hypothetical protein